MSLEYRTTVRTGSSSIGLSGGGTVQGAMAVLAETAWESASEDELLGAARDIETWSRQLYRIALDVTAELDTRGVAASRGATSTAVLLRQVLRISPGQANRRVADARAVCPRVHITGEISQPALPIAAAALAEGAICEEHLRVIRRTVQDLPPDTTPQIRAAVEIPVVAEALEIKPVQLAKAAHRIRGYHEPDGTCPHEKQADRRRG